jgi:hypothetical protein
MLHPDARHFFAFTSLLPMGSFSAIDEIFARTKRTGLNYLDSTAFKACMNPAMKTPPMN